MSFFCPYRDKGCTHKPFKTAGACIEKHIKMCPKRPQGGGSGGESTLQIYQQSPTPSYVPSVPNVRNSTHTGQDLGIVPPPVLDCASSENGFIAPDVTRPVMTDIHMYDKDSIEYLSCITARMVETCEAQLSEELAKRDRLVKKLFRVVPKLQQSLHELTEHRALQAHIENTIKQQNQMFEELY